MSIKRLKKVPYRGKIKAEHDNAIVDNFKGQLSLFNDLSNRMKDPDFAELVEELKKIVSQMWYVKAGDPVQSKLHNLFVDAWNKQIEINENVLKRLAFIPKQYYYVLAKAKTRVLASGVEKLPYKESYSLTPTLATPSGTDPYDPTWAPPEGWDKVWHFETEEEGPNFGNRQYRYAYVENHCLEFNPPSGYYGRAWHSAKAVLKRVACAIKTYRVVTGQGKELYFSLWTADSDLGHMLDLSITLDNTKLIIRVGIPGVGWTNYYIDNPNDYVVVVLDVEENWVRVYDRNKNLLLEVTGITHKDVVYVVFDEFNNYYGDTRETSVDWVAIKYV